MGESRRDGGRGKRPRRGGNRSRRTESESPTVRAKRLLDELNELARGVAEARGYLDQKGGARNELSLPVALRLDGSRPSKEDAQRWLEELRGRVDALMTSDDAFVFGAVRCFLCQSSRCEHARPPDGTHTFAGYGSNGKPEWISLTNLLISLGDGRVEALYAPRPEVIALVQLGAELSDKLLPEFGREDHHFRLVGQVVAGRVPDHLMTRSTRGEPRVLTIQTIESRCPGQRPQLRLNLLGLSYDEIIEAAAEGGARGPAEALRRTIHASRQRLRTFTNRMNRGDAMEQTLSASLSKTRGDVERVFRSVQRRTKHAQAHHEEGKRPTQHAMDDLRKAPLDAFLRDTRRDTFVVLGANSRAHVFSESGRHITSLNLGPGEVDRKRQNARWTAMSKEDAADLRQRAASGSSRG